VSDTGSGPVDAGPAPGDVGDGLGGGSSTDGSPAADGTGIAGGHAPTGTTGPVGNAPGSLNDIADKFARNFTLASRIETAQKAFSEINQAVRDLGISVVDGTGYSGPEGSPAPGAEFGGGDQGNDVGGSQEFPEEKKADTDSTKTTDTDPLSDYIYVPGVGYRRRVRSVKPLSKLKAGGYVSKKGIMARGYSEGGMINSDSSFEEGQVLPTSDIFSEGVYAQVNIDRSVDSENVVESDKVITAPIAFSSAPGKTAYLAYITPEEAASLRQAKQGFSSEGNGLEVSDGQYQHLGPKGLMSFNGQGGGGGDPGPGDGHGGGMSEFVEDLEPEEVEEEKPTDPYEGYTYVKGIGYVPTSRRATSIESASLSSLFTPGFLRTIGLMGDPNEEL
jgi:hypothetical protein